MTGIPARECRICHGILTPYVRSGWVERWLHGGAVYHRPDPGPRTDSAREVCDWCSGPGAEWVVITRPFTVWGAVGDFVDEDGLWATCADCATFVFANDWQGLSDRSVAAMLRLSGPPAVPSNRGLMRRAHRKVREGFVRIDPIGRDDVQHA